jgi:hypothetical protein
MRQKRRVVRGDGIGLGITASSASYTKAAQEEPLIQRWGAHAPRVPTIAPSRSRTFSGPGKNVLAGAPKPAREARALPGILRHACRLVRGIRQKRLVARGEVVVVGIMVLNRPFIGKLLAMSRQILIRWI